MRDNSTYKHRRRSSRLFFPESIENLLERFTNLSEITVRFETRVFRGQLNPRYVNIQTFRRDFYEWLASCRHVKVVNVLFQEHEPWLRRTCLGRENVGTTIGGFGQILPHHYTEIPKSFHATVATISARIEVEAKLISQCCSRIRNPYISSEELQNLEREVRHPSDIAERTEHWQWRAPRGQVMDWSKLEDLFPNKNSRTSKKK